MFWIRLTGSVAGLVLLAGCSSTSPHVVSESIEVAPGVNVARSDHGNIINSIAVRRDATRVNDLAVRDCLHQQVIPASKAPATDILQPDAASWQRPGELQVDGRNVHYRLSLQHLKDQNYFLFDQLGYTVQNSQSESSWMPIPAWKDRQPKALHDALVDKANAVQNCLIQAEDQQRAASARRDARVRSS